MNIIQSHYINEENLNVFFFAQHTEYKLSGKEMLFYNTLFDSVLMAKANSELAAEKFANTLETGCENIMELIRNTFTQEPNAVYALLMNKKIIE